MGKTKDMGKTNRLVNELYSSYCASFMDPIVDQENNPSTPFGDHVLPREHPLYSTVGDTGWGFMTTDTAGEESLEPRHHALLVGTFCRVFSWVVVS